MHNGGSATNIWGSRTMLKFQHSKILFGSIHKLLFTHFAETILRWETFTALNQNMIYFLELKWFLKSENKPRRRLVEPMQIVLLARKIWWIKWCNNFTLLIWNIVQNLSWQGDASTMKLRFWFESLCKICVVTRWCIGNEAPTTSFLTRQPRCILFDSIGMTSPSQMIVKLNNWLVAMNFNT